MSKHASKSPLSSTVWMLSIVSMLADIASEMLYPILPIYLASIGFSAAWLGILEGSAEAVAGISKSWFGALSDRIGRRLPFVSAGYFLSGIAKPAIGYFTHPVGVFACRTLDRLGKGIRSAPRDAILADESTPETRASVFGFHRGMDTLGASIGSCIALIILWHFPENYRFIFLTAIVPGIIAGVLTLAINEKHRPKSIKIIQTWREKLLYWKNSSFAYRRFTLLMLLFALVNSSDMFLLMKMKIAGLENTMIIGMYILYNIVSAVLSYPLGIIGDKFGKRQVLSSGLLLFCIVYFGFGIADSNVALIILIILYGIFNAATQGISQAIISDVSPNEERAAALGTYSGLQSIGSLIAGILAGLFWTLFGHSAMFIISGISAAFIAPFILMQPSLQKAQ